MTLMTLTMVMDLVSIWIAFLIGVMLGWAWNWKPRWEILTHNKILDSFEPKPSTLQEDHFSSSPPTSCCDSTNQVVSNKDLEHLCKLVETKDHGHNWVHLMDRSTPTMTYKAWRRDQKIGPPQYCSSTILENAVPEIVRDFFWDDEFRSNWDDMLAESKTIEECPTTGTMIVQWIRKFPFFCKDREYIIGRRIWESGRSYYCVTKGVDCHSIPRKDRPRRVDLYYSSWCIRAVESSTGNGELTASEVLFFHHEDMGIPWEIAKIGVKKGMWGLVKKIEPGLRSYQRERASGAPISRMAFMANINTKISPPDRVNSLQDMDKDGSSETEPVESEKPQGVNIPKILLISGAIVFACSFDRGLLTKTLIFGVARRFANVQNRT